MGETGLKQRSNKPPLPACTGAPLVGGMQSSSGTDDGIGGNRLVPKEHDRGGYLDLLQNGNAGASALQRAIGLVEYPILEKRCPSRVTSHRERVTRPGIIDGQTRQTPFYWPLP